MTVQDVIVRRGITGVLHFTTNLGALGVLYTGALKARSRLAADKQLEYILTLNAKYRDRDTRWHDYVNLSITKINGAFFEISSGKWHKNEDLFWVVLSFDPSILCHEGVTFTTTNNIYSKVRRDLGEIGIESMFAPKIVRWVGHEVGRPITTPNNVTTCQQAEVLYPKEVALKHLRTIYVFKHEYGDELSAQMAVTNNTGIKIVCQPDRFK